MLCCTRARLKSRSPPCRLQRSSEALSKENAARTELERALHNVQAQARHRSHEAMAARRTADATAAELARCQDVVQQLACPVPQANDEVDVVLPGGGMASGGGGGGDGSGASSGSEAEYSDDFDSDHGPATKGGAGRGRPATRRGTVVARSASCHHVTVSYVDGEVRFTHSTTPSTLRVTGTVVTTHRRTAHDHAD